MTDDIPTSNIDLSHHIQRSIMMQLRQEGRQPYQALKPDGMEGNAFNYHLRNLKKAGLIDTLEDLYELTATGHLVADGFSSPVARLMLRPYAHTAIIATSGSKILLYCATRQPLNGLLTLPSGKMRYGDDLAQSVARELERRHITDNYHTYALCAINIRYTSGGETLIHRPGTLWHVVYTGTLQPSHTPNGTADWYEQAALRQRSDITPDVQLALQRIASRSHEPIDMTWGIPAAR